MNATRDPMRDWFVPAGTIGFSEAAIDLALEFHKLATKTRPNEDWIAVFDWSDSRRFRVKASNTWHDLGAGLDLAVYQRNQVPIEAIDNRHGFALGCKIRPEKVAHADRKVIDIDPTDSSKLVLL